jgi:ABC-type multidrug transport system ATPase subunit
VEVTCDRVAFIKHGEVIRVEELGKLAAGRTAVSIKAEGITAEILQGLEEWASEISANSKTLRMIVHDEAMLPLVNRYLVSRNVAVYSIEPEKVTLEDLFLKIVGKETGL